MSDKKPSCGKSGKAIPPEHNLSPKKRTVFKIIAVSIPACILLLFELLSRLANLGDSHEMFVQFTYHGKEYKTMDKDFGNKYFSRLNYTSPSNDLFLAKKPDNGFRVFVLGSSTVVGFPYTTGNSFPRILQVRLEESYPDRHIEVVNTAITAINSFTLQDRIDEILKEGPDVLLVYAGHNEFYGAMGVASVEGLGKSRIIKIVHLKLLNIRIYQLLGKAIGQIQAALTKNSSDPGIQGETLMESIAKDKIIALDSKDYQLALSHYQANMHTVLRKSKKAGVPVLISDLVANVRDLKPFVDVQTVEHPLASEIFLAAQEAEMESDFSRAKEIYYQAKDLDGLRFRASEDINRIIHRLAEQFDAVFVPSRELFEKHSPHGLIGNNLLTEHVHPNLEGYFLLADAFFTAITRGGFLGDIDSSLVHPPEYYRANWVFTSLDSLFAVMSLDKLYSRWPFQNETANNPASSLPIKPNNIVDSLARMVYVDKSIKMGEAYRLMASYHIKQGEHELAMGYHLAMARLAPHEPDHYIAAGDIALISEEYNKARSYYRSSLRYFRSSYALLKLAENQARENEWVSCTELLEELVASDPGNLEPAALVLLHKSYGMTGNTDKAIELEKRIRQSGIQPGQKQIVIHAPPEVMNKINKARQYTREQRFDEALVLLREANAIQETPVANRYTGDILLFKNDPDAINYLRKAYPEHRENADFLSTLCYAAVKFNQATYAREVLDELIQVNPLHERIAFLEQELKKGKN